MNLHESSYKSKVTIQNNVKWVDISWKTKLWSSGNKEVTTLLALYDRLLREATSVDETS